MAWGKAGVSACNHTLMSSCCGTDRDRKIIGRARKIGRRQATRVPTTARIAASADEHCLFSFADCGDAGPGPTRSRPRA